MKKTLLCFFALTSFSSMAATRQEVRQELRVINQELDYTFATAKQLDEAMKYLANVKKILVTGGAAQPVDFQTCINYVFPQYNRSLNSTPAMEKASIACKAVYDLDVLKFSFEQANRSLNAAPAMDLVVEFNTATVAGKYEMISYSFSQYNRSLNAAPAIEKALSQSALVPLESLDCLKRVFPEYNRSLNAAPAMDKSFETCK